MKKTTPEETMSETVTRAFPNQPTPLLSHGLPFAAALPRHVADTFGATRPYVICSGSLARDTPRFADLRQQLGPALAGFRVGMRSHSLWSEILEVVADVRRCGADCIVTLGAGSLTDAAKIVSYVRNRPRPTALSCTRRRHARNEGDWGLGTGWLKIQSFRD